MTSNKNSLRKDSEREVTPIRVRKECFNVLRSRFPHIKKIIIQSDNAKNLAGKQSKLLLPHVCSAAGFKLVAYYHNEAQSGKEVVTLLSPAGPS